MNSSRYVQTANFFSQLSPQSYNNESVREVSTLPYQVYNEDLSQSQIDECSPDQPSQTSLQKARLVGDTPSDIKVRPLGAKEVAKAYGMFSIESDMVRLQSPGMPPVVQVHMAQQPKIQAIREIATERSSSSGDTIGQAQGSSGPKNTNSTRPSNSSGANLSIPSFNNSSIHVRSSDGSPGIVQGLLQEFSGAQGVLNNSIIGEVLSDGDRSFINDPQRRHRVESRLNGSHHSGSSGVAQEGKASAAPPPPPVLGGRVPPPPPPGQMMMKVQAPPAPKVPEKYQRLMWQKIAMPVDNSIFTQKIEVPNFEEVLTQLELHFPKKAASKVVMPGNTPSRVERIVAPQRAMMMASCIRRHEFNKQDFLAFVHCGADDKIDPEVLQTFKTILPTEAEHTALQTQMQKLGFSDYEEAKKKNRWGEVEDHIFYTHQVPRIQDKVHLMEIVVNWFHKLKTMDSMYILFSKSLSAILENQDLRNIMLLTLMLGNVMNEGSGAMGQAKAYKLEILPRLFELKSQVDADKCLFDLIWEQHKSMIQQPEYFNSILSVEDRVNLENCAKAEILDIKQMMTKLIAQQAEVVKEYTSWDKETDSRFASSLHLFIEDSQSFVTKMQDYFSPQLNQFVEKFNEYFGLKNDFEMVGPIVKTILEFDRKQQEYLKKQLQVQEDLKRKKEEIKREGQNRMVRHGHTKSEMVGGYRKPMIKEENLMKKEGAYAVAQRPPSPVFKAATNLTDKNQKLIDPKSRQNKFGYAAQQRKTMAEQKQQKSSYFNQPEQKGPVKATQKFDATSREPTSRNEKRDLGKFKNISIR